MPYPFRPSLHFSDTIWPILYISLPPHHPFHPYPAHVFLARFMVRALEASRRLFTCFPVLTLALLSLCLPSVVSTEALCELASKHSMIKV